MEKLKLDINKYKNKAKKERKPTHRGASIVYDFLDKYTIDYKEEWGNRLAKAMLRQQKKGILEHKIINVEETLEWLKREKIQTPKKEEIYKGIMSSQSSKTRYFWNKFIKPNKGENRILPQTQPPKKKTPSLKVPAKKKPTLTLCTACQRPINKKQDHWRALSFTLNGKTQTKYQHVNCEYAKKISKVIHRLPPS